MQFTLRAKGAYLFITRLAELPIKGTIMCGVSTSLNSVARMICAPVGNKARDGADHRKDIGNRILYLIAGGLTTGIATDIYDFFCMRGLEPKEAELRVIENRIKKQLFWVTAERKNSIEVNCKFNGQAHTLVLKPTKVEGFVELSLTDDESVAPVVIEDIQFAELHRQFGLEPVDPKLADTYLQFEPVSTLGLPYQYKRSFSAGSLGSSPEKEKKKTVSTTDRPPLERTRSVENITLPVQLNPQLVNWQLKQRQISEVQDSIGLRSSKLATQQKDTEDTTNETEARLQEMTELRKDYERLEQLKKERKKLEDAEILRLQRLEQQAPIDSISAYKVRSGASTPNRLMGASAGISNRGGAPKMIASHSDNSVDKPDVKSAQSKKEFVSSHPGAVERLDFEDLAKRLNIVIVEEKQRSLSGKVGEYNTPTSGSVRSESTFQSGTGTPTANLSPVLDARHTPARDGSGSPEICIDTSGMKLGSQILRQNEEEKEDEAKKLTGVLNKMSVPATENCLKSSYCDLRSKQMGSVPPNNPGVRFLTPESVRANGRARLHQEEKERSQQLRERRERVQRAEKEVERMIPASTPVTTVTSGLLTPMHTRVSSPNDSGTHTLGLAEPAATSE